MVPEPEKKQRLVLIDGHSLVYRAFFALPSLTDREGNVVNAAYGFTSMLLLALQELFFFNDTATTEIYTLSLHDALPISRWSGAEAGDRAPVERFRRECPSRAHFEIAERRKRFGFVLSRSQGAEGVNRVTEDPSCGRGVPAPPSGQADSQSDLCPVLRISGRPQQEPFEYDLSALIALTFQEHARHPKLRKKLLLLLLNSRALREPLRAPVLPPGFGQSVELERKIRARARARSQRRPAVRPVAACRERFGPLHAATGRTAGRRWLQVGRAHVWTPVTISTRMPSSA